MRIMAVVVVVAMSRIQTRKQRQTLKPNGKAQLFPTTNTFCNHGKKKNAEQHIDISECRTCGFSNDGIIT